jgi:hypothetical protein
MSSRLLALAVAGALLAFGCASRVIPPADYIHGPYPHQARRAPDYGSQTLWSTLHRNAYEPLTQAPSRLSPDQDLVVHEYGPPTHRREFRSLEGEVVVEWLNVDQNRLFQFTGGRLIFDGDIRDLEHTLLRYGSPQDVTYHQFDPEIERVTFIYRQPYTMRMQYFDFANGTLDYEEHHN